MPTDWYQSGQMHRNEPRVSLQVASALHVPGVAHSLTFWSQFGPVKPRLSHRLQPLATLHDVESHWQ